LVHGDADEVVPVEALFGALHGLAAAELAAEWHISPRTGHGIAPDGLGLAAGFLQHYLDQ
jgi:phospholipase/carboxylesterase